MKPIGLVLEDFQFKVEMPGQIAGRSGALHRFDAVATKGASEVVVLDVIASEKQIDEVAVASMYVTLKVRPVKLRDSLYLLIPVDIARLLGVASSSDFQLSLNENQDSVKLVYELKKDENQTVDEKRE